MSLRGLPKQSFKASLASIELCLLCHLIILIKCRHGVIVLELKNIWNHMSLLWVYAHLLWLFISWDRIDRGLQDLILFWSVDIHGC